MRYLVALVLTLVSGCGKDSARQSIAFLGDSMTEHFDWAGNFPEYDVTVVANGGRQSSGVLESLVLLSATPFDSAYLMVGVNDLSHSVPESTTAQNVREIIMRLRALRPDAVLYLDSVLPLSPERSSTPDGAAFNARIESLNAAYRALATDVGAQYIDAYPAFVGCLECYVADGLHLTQAGYARWISILRK